MYPDEFHIDIDYELDKLDDDNWFKKYDVVHYHRTLGPYENHKEIIERCKTFGIPTFMDIDDHWAPGPHHPAFLMIKNNEIDKKILSNLRSAENIITTTPLFVKELESFTKAKNIYVLPNAIDTSEKQFKPDPEKSDRIRIGWLGGSSHEKDLELLGSLVGQLDRDGLMDKIQFVLCGYDLRGNISHIDEHGQQSQRPIKPKESVWYRYEKIFTNNYTSISKEYKDWLMKFKKGEYENVANEPYRRVWTKPISTYAKNYNLFDISLAPIEENTFNKVKSQLKVIEAGFHKKAIVAQDFGPYQIDLTNAYVKSDKKGVMPTFDENANAYLINSSRNHKQWYQHLKRLIMNPDQIEILANNLYDTVKDTYSIEAVTAQRRDLYKKGIKDAKAILPYTSEYLTQLAVEKKEAVAKLEEAAAKLAGENKKTDEVATS